MGTENWKITRDYSVSPRYTAIFTQTPLSKLMSKKTKQKKKTVHKLNLVHSAEEYFLYYNMTRLLIPIHIFLLIRFSHIFWVGGQKAADERCVVDFRKTSSSSS